MTLASPRLPFSLIAIFAGGLLRATRFSPRGHYEPEGLYTLCGSNCDFTYWSPGRVYPIYQYEPMCSNRVHGHSHYPQTLHPDLH